MTARPTEPEASVAPITAIDRGAKIDAVPWLRGPTFSGSSKIRLPLDALILGQVLPSSATILSGDATNVPEAARDVSSESMLEGRRGWSQIWVGVAAPRPLAKATAGRPRAGAAD
jgi:hypothetical protein